MTDPDRFYPPDEDEDPGAPAVEMLDAWPGEPVELVIDGDPVPWAPAQMNRKTGGRFIPARQAQQAARIIQRWKQSGIAMLPKGDPSRGVVVGFEFYVERPKKHYRTGRFAHLLKEQYVGARPSGKPDLSNLVKLFEDALTTHAWADDDQIVQFAGATKDYGRPRSVMRIWLAAPRPEDPVALGAAPPEQAALVP